MSDEKQYRYYRTTGELVAKLACEYEPIGIARNAILEKTFAKTGAIGVTLTPPFLDKHYGLIDRLAFPAAHDFGAPVEILRRGEIEGCPVVIVKGAGKSKEAKALNAEHNTWVSEANLLLKDAPAYLGFVLERFSLFASKSVDRRVLSPYGGLQPGNKDALLLAIPVNGDDAPGEIPAGFERITFGAFYDAMHPDQLG